MTLHPILERWWKSEARYDEDEFTKTLPEAVGRRIENFWFSEDFGLVLTLDDGRYLIAEGVWMNTGEARTSAGVWAVPTGEPAA